jgi:hypothetical protein
MGPHKLWLYIRVFVIGTEKGKPGAEIAQSVQRQAMGSKTGVWFQAGARFSLFQSGSGVHSASYSKGTGDFSAGLKWPGHEANKSPLSNSKVKNVVAIPPLPKTSSCHSAWFIKRRENFTFYGETDSPREFSWTFGCAHRRDSLMSGLTSLGLCQGLLHESRPWRSCSDYWDETRRSWYKWINQILGSSTKYERISFFPSYDKINE